MILFGGMRCDTALATKQSPGLFLPNANAFGASCLLHCVQFTHRTLQICILLAPLQRGERRSRRGDCAGGENIGRFYRIIPPPPTVVPHRTGARPLCRCATSPHTVGSHPFQGRQIGCLLRKDPCFLHSSYFVKILGKGWGSAIANRRAGATIRVERKWRYEQSAGQILYQSGQRHRATV